MERVLASLLVSLALVGCSSASAPEPTSESGGETDQVLIVGALQEGEPPPPPREPPIVPELREVPAAGQAEGAFVDLETAYASVLGAPLGTDAPTATMQDAVALLVDQLGHAITLVQHVDAAARALPENARGRGLLRRADARAALAARAVGSVVPPSADIEARIADTSEEVRVEVRAEVARRIRETLADRMRPLWCQAAALYAEVEALGGPEAEVARARRAGYGERFLASCPR